jgi:hypothetical protein
MFRPIRSYRDLHHTFRAELDGGRFDAINFTDRQLGWLPLVVPWPAYLRTRLKASDTFKKDILAADGSGRAHKCKDGYPLEIHRLESRKDELRERCFEGTEDTEYHNLEDFVDLPTYDMVLEDQPWDWEPDTSPDEKGKEAATERYKCWLQETMKRRPSFYLLCERKTRAQRK